MRLTSHSISASIVLTFCAAASVAQAPLASADASPSANTAPQSDTREVPASSHTVSASQIRIVRLSEVKGQVQLNRNTGQSFELAFNNLPIIAGEQLRTLQGVAEVEFEDNSSLRLTPDSQVDFPTLGRDDAGAAMTAVTLLRGTMYVSLASTKTVSNFTIHVGHETLTLAPASHFRLDTDSKTAKLTVFQGEVTAVSDSGSLVVSKHKAATFDLNSTDAPVFARMDEPSPFDTWDKNAVDYHKALAIAASNGISPYSYGTNDLAYYGSFSNVGGCGLMWRPYLASASFSPYASGVWAWYPGSGYSWVSPYPWGWTPYHSGSWSYCEGAGGWGWQPQGNWNGLANQPAAASFKISGTIRPHPPVSPIKGQSTLVPVNLSALQVSQSGEGNAFVFHGASAGFGVPRGVFDNLAKISQNAADHGFTMASISETQAARGLMPSYLATMSGTSSKGSHGANTSSSSFAGSTSTASSLGSGSPIAAHSFTAPAVSFSSAGTTASSGSTGGAAHH